ncbi:LytTR family DNA-binding domain-containing protein [Pseudomonas coleopterorum]|jgi:two-component system response regulator AlgR|uniref:LytTR family DNA-binding domain-containing protein n=1 Tax=Pseudomonas coleopterorum TaxID=1605838 RepID=A0AAJ6LZY8_9PSED|nr:MULTISPECIES: LytTR family DNA-binding domain-containing protein [Pseudomonas]KTC33762.1 chemotaxis protein CheY [Pseudomonas putida]KNC14771.1 chemotaxis protein CheY [Pseudomonas sp. RIT-PI-a]MBD8481254.1 response regulator transcription factor [Pseudomonas coleopterorum]MDY1017132.1 LytTR family DNA-binding domain-containing protein [Pseudomonas coleopterorum]MDY1048565.1 LytTR family DNA-binding domain-containing protein [Pseudomonas coleopterorum]
MNVLIVDDEPLARERLSRLVGELEGYHVLEPGASNGEEALSMIEAQKPDVVLLDIRMPGLDGLQVAAKLCERDTPPAVVFCTAHDEFALDAFQVSAVGYLVKPVRSEHLLEALKKAEKPNRVQLAALTRPAAEAGTGPRSHISARTRKGIELIPLDQVIYFIADHKYVTLRHEGGEVLLDEPLKALEDEFGDRFVRIHRNALVARERIERLQRTPLGHFQLYLKGLNGDALIVSRRHVAGVRKMMQHL